MMDARKIGKLILELRKDKKLTQQEVADRLCISNKTVSKWECGLGCPDVSLWEDLAEVLGADLLELLRGELIRNRLDNGKISNIKFYICSTCRNILTSTGNSAISCCGRKLVPLEIKEQVDNHEVSKKFVDIDMYYQINHEMTKDHYISFAALVYEDRVLIIRMYPEQAAAFRIPISMEKGKLLIYCTKHGLQRVNTNGMFLQ
ncbi:MAG: helix-turn-helix domain-containing protein [Anaerorhabdus sp.]|uniref:helix-turn-helix domain-containing protein n=1 Tax=Anaerorhabdus sp. TaxID=1872524 RepID=UPI003A89B1D6